MPLNFPSSPSLNDEYTFGGSTYTWNGSVWGVKAAAVADGVHMSDTAPANPVAGDMWWRTNDGRLYIYYEDIDGAQWVEANSGLTPTGAVTVSSTAPTSPNVGDLWYDDTDTHRMYIYYSDGTSSYWTDTNPDTRPQQLVGKFGARIVDNKGSTIAGGSSIAGTQTRELNTIEYDRDGIVTLASNQFTLAPGKWRIIFSAPAYKCGGHQAMLVDVTAGNTTAAVGTAEFTSTGSGVTASRSFGTLEVELTSNNVYRIDHWTETSKSTDGLGVTDGSPAEDAIYTTVDIEAVESIVTTADIVQTGTSVSSVAAWGTIDNSVTGKLLDGLNIASVNRTGTGTYDVTFATPMPNANYAVVTGHGPNNDKSIQAWQKTSNGFRIRCDSPDDGIDLYFAVLGTNALPPTGGTGADAWGSIATNGTLGSNFNIDSVSKTSTGTYSVTFTTPMPTDDYSLTVTPGAIGVQVSVIVNSKSTTGFDYIIFNSNNGGNVDGPSNFVVHASNASLPDSVTTAQVSKAWVNFDGTGSITIRDSFNVSSVTDNGTGNYTLNFTNAMSNSNYTVAGSSTWSTGSWGTYLTPDATSAYSTTSVTIRTVYTNHSTGFVGIDSSHTSVQIFGS